jgi:hypothetical protein
MGRLGGSKITRRLRVSEGNSTMATPAAYNWRAGGGQTGPSVTHAPEGASSEPEDGMATKLDKTIKRELDLDGKLYTVAISPEGVKVTPKGARKGHEVSWSSLIGGETELRRDLNSSIDAYRE